MTWSDGTTSLTCEECGHVDRFEAFVWVLGELAVCQNGEACHRRQERLARIEELKNRPVVKKKQSWFKKLIGPTRKRS